MSEAHKIDSNKGKLLNGIALAYIGDAVWEVYVRDHLLSLGLTKPGQLQKEATMYVSAKAQAKLAEDWNLTEEEQSYFLRGRNAHSKTTAKNTDVVTYRVSTGFEAVFGFLHLTNRIERESQLAEFCIETIFENK
ncbi:ribonuclease-3 family protein [Lactovum miscens]|uniref:Mini-ribonuclease 3 n=1 Tax=Lactovum miscens TaxID=190387 RepID=A0A841C510_9LACT|nr:ribonuclease-3 family protein [Lactovum miscens]